MDASFTGGEIKGSLTVTTICDGLDTRGRIFKNVEFTLNGNGERMIHEIDLSTIDSVFVGATLNFATAGHANIYSFEFAD